ncbi:MAG TPA: NAD(P)-dependent oxidoreductase [Clostridiaceae bacterium]|nr:NAD(P)-dependent oxidoreductase [Clostridiaceae bacterium]
MKILIIGGTGHVGSFLTEQLLEQGHQVVIASRNQKVLPANSPLRKILHKVRIVKCDSGVFENLKELAKECFDVVIDFPGTAYNTYMAFRDTACHIIACGSLWMFGYPHVVPTPEIRQEKCVFEGYEKRYQEILEMIADSGKHRAVFTAIMPPNICGPGKIPLETCGGRSIDVHHALKEGKTVFLPEGPEALIGPCDASDIAALFALAVNNRIAAAGQIFNAGSAYAVTVSQFVKIYSDIYGVDIPIERVSWEVFKKDICPDIGQWWHFYAHMQPDISKACKLLGYKPRYTPEETIARAVDWMFAEKLL